MMKGDRFWIIILVIILVSVKQACGFDAHRFVIENYTGEITLKYRKYKELIILSAQLNDSMPVNLILDTGCRNTILFGRKYDAVVNPYTSKTIAFSGLGNNSPLLGRISLNNELQFNGVKGSGVVIVVVPSREFVYGMPEIDGVIGYDLLRWFEIEVNPKLSTVTFRNPDGNCLHGDYFKFNLNPDEILPFVSGKLKTTTHTNTDLPLLIDTGSQLGVLLKSYQINENNCEVIARGLCGYIKGTEAYASVFNMNDIQLSSNLIFYVIPAKNQEMLSIGMDFLKDYVFIINSVKQYAAIKRYTHNPDA